MASILIFGGAEFARPFAESIPNTYSVFVHGADAGAYAGHDHIMPFADSDAFPGGLQAVVDLGYDRASRHALVANACSSAPLFITNALTITATQAAADMDCVPTIGISYVPALFGNAPVLEAAPALQTSQQAADDGMALLHELTGKDIEVVVDRMGLVSIRTLAMIVNEAAFALMEGVAGPDDIDTAMKLGTSYPEGPLRWADMIGIDLLLNVLHALHQEYGEERYRPCVLLKQFARAGRRFTTERIHGV